MPPKRPQNTADLRAERDALADWAAFADWLPQSARIVGEYRPKTLAKTLSEARLLAGRLARGLAPAGRPPARLAARRLAEWHTAGGALSDVVAGPLHAWLAEPPRHSSARKLAARSYDPSTLQTLIEAARGDESLEARAIEVAAATGLRASDVLRVNRYALRLALERGTLTLEQKGGHERVIVLDDGGDEWRRLYEQWLNYDGDVLALTICPGSDPARSDCAYKRVRAKLAALAEACGITVERVHMHRFRRTFGMNFYHATRDVVLTGKALGHGRGSRATLSYLDEAEPERVAEVVRDLRARGKR